MKWALAIFLSVSFVFLTVFGVNCCFGFLFPTKFEEEVTAACEKFGMDKAVVFSVINIESHFNADAVSKKGAVGLMQILPSTAEELAVSAGLEEFDLKAPKDNILLGTCYLSQLSKKFDCLETALCAYNAGPANVTTWLKEEEKSEDGKTLKSIPFAETRGYIKKFRRNFKYYSHKLR